jgi:hypothetical protein
MVYLAVDGAALDNAIFLQPFSILLPVGADLELHHRTSPEFMHAHQLTLWWRWLCVWPLRSMVGSAHQLSPNRVETAIRRGMLERSMRLQMAQVIGGTRSNQQQLVKYALSELYADDSDLSWLMWNQTVWWNKDKP